MGLGNTDAEALADARQLAQAASFNESEPVFYVDASTLALDAWAGDAGGDEIDLAPGGERVVHDSELRRAFVITNEDVDVAVSVGADGRARYRIGLAVEEGTGRRPCTFDGRSLTGFVPTLAADHEEHDDILDVLEAQLRGETTGRRFLRTDAAEGDPGVSFDELLEGFSASACVKLLALKVGEVATVDGDPSEGGLVSLRRIA